MSESLANGPARRRRVRGSGRELEREQIGRRMREGAKQMRDGGAAGARKSSWRRTLDEVVQQLADAGRRRAKQADQLDQTREIEDRLDQFERQIADAEAKQKSSRARPQWRTIRKGGCRIRLGIAEARTEYSQALQQAREALGSFSRAPRGAALAGRTPEKAERSQADPGNQPFKQDYSGWESLRKDVNLALERTEAAVSARIAGQTAQDRLSAGGSDRVPDAYRRLIARYYESLARSKKVEPP